MPWNYWGAETREITLGLWRFPPSASASIAQHYSFARRPVRSYESDFQFEAK